MAAARNAGLREAQAEWIAFLDDDDLWAPEKLTRQIAAARAAGAGMAYSGVVNVDPRGRVLGVFAPPDPSTLRERMLGYNVIPAGASNVVVHCEVMAEIGGFDESFPHLADWDAWIRISRLVPAAVDPAVTIAYVHHDGNRAGRFASEMQRDFDTLRVKHAAEAKAAGVSFDEVLFARFLAGARRRAGDRAGAARLYASSGMRHRDLQNLARAAYSMLGLPNRPRQRREPPRWLVEQ